jgi:hypothetical protein
VQHFQVCPFRRNKGFCLLNSGIPQYKVLAKLALVPAPVYLLSCEASAQQRSDSPIKTKLHKGKPNCT